MPADNADARLWLNRGGNFARPKTASMRHGDEFSISSENLCEPMFHDGDEHK